MTNHLAIDIGNTAIKIGIFSKEQRLLRKETTDDHLFANVLSKILEREKISGGITCSVANISTEMQNALDEIPNHSFLSTTTHTPLINAYHAPQTLGMDRLAAAVAAHNMFPDKTNMVVCLGTCITYNLVTKNKAYRGGAISPGLRMRLKAMAHFTDKLPEVDLHGDLLLLGYDTETCMRSGAVYGMAAEVHGMLQALGAQYPDFNPVLTGGDAQYFERHSKSKIFADSDLVLKGLSQIYTYNAPLFS